MTTRDTVPAKPVQHGLRLAVTSLADRINGIEQAALPWAHSLILLKGVAPASVFVHTVAPDLDVLGPMQALGVQIMLIARFDDGRHRNKLARFSVVPPARLELATSGSTIQRSNQLS